MPSNTSNIEGIISIGSPECNFVWTVQIKLTLFAFLSFELKTKFIIYCMQVGVIGFLIQMDIFGESDCQLYLN